MAIQETPPPVLWNDLVATAGRAFDIYLPLYQPDQTSRVEAFSLLSYVASGLMESCLHDFEDLRDIWTQIRSNSGLLNTLWSTYAHALETTGMSHNAVCAYLATVTASMRPTPGMFDDSVFLASLATKEELLGVYGSNPWLVVLVLLKRAGKLNLLRPEAKLESQA